MPRQTPQDKLEALREQQRQIAARIQAEQAKLSAQARKDDTRRKVVLGAIALEHLTKNANDPLGSKLRALADEYVLDRDRHLFDFLETREGAKRGKNGAAAEPPQAGK